MPVNIVCGKCGEHITEMKMLKSVKDSLAPSGGKCPACGVALSSSEFDIDAKDNDYGK